MVTHTHVFEELGAYIDGELGPAERVRVAHHLAVCRECADALSDIRALGDLLRSNAEESVDAREFAGLAAGVFSRMRAEELESWRGLWSRARSDWRHWSLVGAGAFCSAIVSVLTVSALVGVSASYEHEDSLASILDNLQAPTGRLIILATPVGKSEATMLMEVGAPEIPSEADELGTLPQGFSGPSPGDLAIALSNAVIRPDGRVRELQSMSRDGREQTEAILDEIQLLGGVPGRSFSSQAVKVKKVGFVTNTQVTSKAL